MKRCPWPLNYIDPMNIVAYQSHYLNSMTHSNRITLIIFLPTEQLNKLVDCWVNLNGEGAWGSQGCRRCQKTSVWVSKRAMVARSEGCHERAITAEQTRIAACQDRCLQRLLRGQQLLRQVSVCERTHRACARPLALSHLEACEKNRRSTCCRAVWIWIRYMNAAREVQSEAKRSRKRKRTK